MKSYILFCAILFIFSAIPAQGAVGITQTQFTDSARGRTLKTYIWYPCVGGKSSRYAENVVFEGFEAVKDGEISQGQFPVFVLIHGTSGNWRNLSWLAERLADSGSIVIAADHPDYTTGDATPYSVIRAWDQPKDVSFILDKLFTSRFKDYIDRKRVLAVGYSLGGYSSLALAGARLDMHQYLDFCSAHDDNSCRYFRPAFTCLDGKYFGQSSVDLNDKRFTGIIAIAPGFMESFTGDSLHRIKVPTLIIGATLDRNVSPSTHILPRKNDLAAQVSYKEIEGAAHFSFMQVCKPKGIEILAEDGEEFVCIDGGSKTRREIHDELFNYIRDFLNAAFK
ncbi:alpha/beta hydrolase family protein [Maridesulfovibrio sp. FT414]|uniref:alpha/beta hydrolase family protein n=1 Tax=Maridesulfovibrio sp. FT414 TaxID=2979469 RepID=UPI003D80339E